MLRIFPLYFGYLCLAAAVVWALGQSGLVIETYPYLLTFTYNLYNIFHVTEKFFGHLWTLSVEEQFYIIYPFAVFYLNRPHLIRLLVAVLLLSPLLRLVVGNWPDPDPSRIIYAMTFLQMDAFAAGGLLALVDASSRRTGLVIGIVTLLALITEVVPLLSATYARFGQLSLDSIYRESLDYYALRMFGGHRHVTGYSALVAFSAAAVYLAQRRKGWVHAVIASAPLVLIGKVSFGVYILHMPLLLPFRWVASRLPGGDRLSDPGQIGLWLSYVLVVVALAWLSFRYFESRFLARKPQIGGVSRTPQSRRVDEPLAP